MSGGKYPIGTIREMAAIPSPQRERFLAELPAILDGIQGMEVVMPEMAAEAHSKAPAFWRWLFPPSALARAMTRQMVAKIHWVDDDKATGTLSVATKPGGDPFWSRTVPLAERAKGGAS